jgi:predicted Zn-dependent peptidase
MADMVWRPRFADEDLEQEREIVLEEIAMYEDDPQDKVFDVLGEAVFGSHPLGRAILGHADVVAGTPAPGLAAFHAARYIPGQVVVAAGRLGRPRPPRGARAGHPARPSASAPRARAVTPLGHARAGAFVTKDTEQTHVCLAAPGSPRDDERRYALRLLDAILGGTSSSRLFQEVREKRGLAYSVYSFQSLFSARPGRLYLGHAARQRRPGAARRRRRARPRALRAGQRRGARPGQGERQGSASCWPRVDVARMNRLGASCSPTCRC